MKLIFVYNANAGKINALLDSAHKMVSPATYNCNLCDITFGIFSENTIWKNFRESSEIEMVFLHKDEFLKQYKSKWLPKYDFPVILSEENGALEVFISTETLNQIKTASELIRLIETSFRV
ncbi:GTPase [Patiriisocius hiemis]|uniref:GTPase n=1 Tax=Patiriisocius hiemis TaxID=3075604 RepID=A0ABU2YDC8_9FLAO|nr:GTPase [Constantimarinum sp. W242]MDT0555767.1 GTPase [Constantimarinum sp. W242]